MKKIIMLMTLLLITSVMAKSTRNHVIKSQRGEYQLNFDVTYTTYVNRGISTMIELPKGYTYTGNVTGAGYYVSVSELQNVAYITKLAEPDFHTNIIFHVITPEKFEKRLLFKVIGKRKNAPEVYAIQFQDPNVSEINSIVREMKNRYDDQLSMKLADQEKRLTTAIRDSVVYHSRAVRIKETRRGKKKIKNKGVELFVDGIVNNNGFSYITVISNTPYDGNCLKVDLPEIATKSNQFPAALLDVHENELGDIVYLFRCSEITPHKKKNKFGRYKGKRFKFNFKIWDEKNVLKLKLS